MAGSAASQQYCPAQQGVPTVLLSSLPPAQTWAVTVGGRCAGGGAGWGAASSWPALRDAVRVSSRSMI